MRNDNDWLVLSVLIIACVIIFGGNLGLTIYQADAIETPVVPTVQPSALALFDWIWQGVSFFFAIISFTVPGVPYIISIIYIIITLMPAFILLKFVRGTNT